MTGRENRNSRRAPSRQPRDRILVVCGGRKTEPQYLVGLRRHFRNPAVQIRVIPDGRDPRTMVDAIPRRLRNLQEDFDQVWCIFDVDEFDVEAAITAAIGSRTSVAISNPCFEVWLLMHLREVTVAFPDARAARRALEIELPYDKRALNFEAFADGIRAAAVRAKSLHQTPDACGPNPSSGMWRLVELIADDELR